MYASPFQKNEAQQYAEEVEQKRSKEKDIQAVWDQTTKNWNEAQKKLQAKPKIISRSEWGAKAPKGELKNIGTNNLKNYYNSIVIHHTGNGDNNPTPQSIQNEKMSNGYSDIAYNFLIGQDGTIYEGRSLTKEQAHLLGQHCGIIGIALLGDYSYNDKGVTGLKRIVESTLGSSSMTRPMLNSLRELAVYLKNEYGIDFLGGHAEFHEVLNSGEKESGDRYCPGDMGSAVVDVLRSNYGFKPPYLMTKIEKDVAGNY